MNIKKVYPNIEQTFGTLEFAGLGKVKTTGGGRNEKISHLVFNLFSSLQKADNIHVIIPAKVGTKEFAYDEKIKLVNPYLEAKGEKSNSVYYVDYIMYADDIVKA